MRLRLGPTLFVLPLTAVACFSASSSGNPNVDFDASFDASFDSTTPDGEGPDTAMVDAPAEGSPIADTSVPPVDAPTDTPVESATPTPVTVVVGGAAGFETGVPVVFADTTGTPIGNPIMTGAGGVAAAVVPTGGMVTILLGTPTNPAPYTVMGLKPGDTVVVADTASVAPLRAETASISAAPTSDAGLGSYTANAGPCNNSTGMLPLPLALLPLNPQAGTCIGLAQQGANIAAAYPLLVQGFDPFGAPLGFAFSKGNALVGADDAGVLNVAVGGTWSTDSTTQTMVVTDASDAGVPANLQLTYSEIANGVELPLAMGSAPVSDGGPTPYGAFQTHVGYADSVQIEATVNTMVGPYGTVLVSAGSPPSASATVSLDVTALGTAPNLTGASVTAAEPTIAWTLSSGDLSSATGVIAMARWTWATEAGTQTGLWTIVSPGTASSSLQAPPLPGSVSGYGPQPGAAFPETTVYAITGQTAIPTYRSLETIGSLFTTQDGPCYLNAPALPPLVNAGTAVVSIYSTGLGGGC